MKKIEIYTDGACSGNPGKGGWGAILVYNKNEKEKFGVLSNRGRCFLSPPSISSPCTLARAGP